MQASYSLRGVSVCRNFVFIAVGISKSALQRIGLVPDRMGDSGPKVVSFGEQRGGNRIFSSVAVLSTKSCCFFLTLSLRITHFQTPVYITA